MKKIIIKIFLLSIVFSITLNNYAQITVSIGNDTTFCGSNIENGVELASHLTVSGGIEPYTYSWTMECFRPYDFSNTYFCAGDYLDDTTIQNPTFTEEIRTNPFSEDWHKFILTVTDSEGSYAKDSINIRFSIFSAMLLGDIVYYLDEGDSVLIDITNYNPGYILPYMSYNWNHSEEFDDPTSPQTWCHPNWDIEPNFYTYTCSILDSVGCPLSYTFYVDLNLGSVNEVNNVIKIYQSGKTIFLPSENTEPVDIYFYDVSGKLILKDKIYSNNYTPNLETKEQMLICSIVINNKVYNIKYLP